MTEYERAVVDRSGGDLRFDHGADMNEVRDAVDGIRAGAQDVPVEQLAPMSDYAYLSAAFIDSEEEWAWDGAQPKADDSGRAR